MHPEAVRHQSTSSTGMPRAENMHNQFYSQPFLSTRSSAMHQPSFSQGYIQTPFARQHPAYPPYQQFTQYPTQSVVVSSPVQPDQQQSSHPHQTKQENAQDQHTGNNILPSHGHIFAITQADPIKNMTTKEPEGTTREASIRYPQDCLRTGQLGPLSPSPLTKTTSKCKITLIVMLSLQWRRSRIHTAQHSH